MPAISIIPSDQTSMFDVLNNLRITRPDKYQAIVRPNNPPAGIAGYVFDIVGEQSMEMNSDITDHYLENNSAIQDQISLKPEKYTVKGLVAELVLNTPTQQTQESFVNPLPLFSPLAPEFTEAATEIQSASAADSESAINSVVDTQSLYSFFNGNVGSLSQTRQSKAFAYFYQLWLGRQLFSVETPWGVMNDMAIESLSPTQGDETRYKTDFSITFKKMRFAQSVTVNIGQLAGRAAQQRADTTQQAKATTTPVTPVKAQSFLVQMLN